MSNLGISFGDGCYADGPWLRFGDGYHAIIQRGNLRHVRLLGAAQHKDALAREREIRPQTVVHFRHMIHTPPGGADKTDDGMWKLPPAEWRENIYFAHGYDKYRMHAQTDNEFSTDLEAELAHYTQWQSQLAHDATTFDMRLDMLSFPTHWPAYHKGTENWLAAGKFDDLFRAIATNQGPADKPRIWCTPNCYWNDGNTDGLRNVKALWQRFKFVTGVAPHMVCGEYAWIGIKDGQFDADGGYKKYGVTADYVIRYSVAHFEAYLLGYGIGAMLYSVGDLGAAKVTHFAFDAASLSRYAQLASGLAEPAPVPDTKPLPDPAPVPEPPPTDGDTKPVTITPAFLATALKAERMQWHLDMAAYHTAQAKKIKEELTADVRVAPALPHASQSAGL